MKTLTREQFEYLVDSSWEAITNDYKVEWTKEGTLVVDDEEGTIVTVSGVEVNRTISRLDGEYHRLPSNLKELSDHVETHEHKCHPGAAALLVTLAIDDELLRKFHEIRAS